VVVPQPNVVGAEVVTNTNDGNVTMIASPTTIALFNVNEKENGEAVAAVLSTRDMLSPVNTVAMIAVDDSMAVAAILIEPAIVSAIVRIDKSAFCKEPGVVAPVAIVSVHIVCFDNVAVPAVNVKAASAAPLLEPTTVKVVDPQPVSVTEPSVAQTKLGNTTTIVSDAVRSAVTEKAKEIEVAEDMVGDLIFNVLALITGFVTAVDSMIAVAPMLVLSARVTAIVLEARLAD